MRRWITVGYRQPLYRRHYGPSGTAAGDEADRNAGAAATIARILDRHGDERLARGVEIGFERGERGVGKGAGADAVEADQGDIVGNAAPRFLKTLEQIGRASCRERVCQYV